MSSAVAKYWSTTAVPCSPSYSTLQARGGDTGRRSVGLLDAAPQAFDSLGADIDETDDTYVHGSDLHDER
jgi:hypothetical protein